MHHPNLLQLFLVLVYGGMVHPPPFYGIGSALQLTYIFQERFKKYLMSGDNRFLDYNEPGAMCAYALSLGVPEDAIVLDYAGRRTYDTCYRAHAIFGIQQAVLVTQSFHLPRALFTCNMLWA